MNKSVYEALKVIAGECNKNPLGCRGCAFESKTHIIDTDCLLKQHNPASLFAHISKKEVYEFDELL